MISIVLVIFLLILNIQMYMTNQTYDSMDKQIFNLSNSIKYRIDEIESEMIFSNSVGVFNDHINYDVDSPYNDVIRRFLSKFNEEIGQLQIYNDEKVKIYTLDENNYFKVFEFKNNYYPLYEEITHTSNDYLIIPIWNDDQAVEANIRLTINIKNIVLDEISNFYINGEYWIWYVDRNYNLEPIYYSDGQLIENRFRIENKSTIIDNIQQNLKASEEMDVAYDRELITLTSYYPLKFRDTTYGLGFSVSKNSIIRSITTRIIVLIVLFGFLFVIITSYLSYIISQKNAMTKNLSEARDSIVTIIENVPFAILIYKNNLDILDVNESFTNLFEMEDKEMIGKKLNQFIPIEELRTNENNLASIEIDEKEMNIIYKIIPIKYKGRHIKLFTLVDVTEIQRARELAERSNKVKGEFIANISHEIRTPMNGIIASVDILKGMNLSEESLEYVDVIEKSSTSLLDLINNILDFSKIESGKYEVYDHKFNIYEVAETISIQFKSLIRKKQLDYRYHIDDNIPENLIGDYYKLEQILINLIGNAIKFTKEGKILFKVNLIRKEASTVVLEFLVADTGIGIPQDKIENIFDVFVQIDSSDSREFEGTGLGTTISKKLVTLMGGEITVESPHHTIENYETGTCFKVTLPFKINKDLIINENSYDLKIAERDLEVLLVEDNEINAKVGKRILEKLGFHVSVAFSGLEAIALVKQQKYDLIFMDIQMPKMDGYEATKKIKKIDKDLVVIALTANDETSVKDKAIKNGMDFFITKPIKKRKINEILKLIKL